MSSAGSGTITASECARTCEWTGRPSFSSSHPRTSHHHLPSSGSPEPQVTESPSTTNSNGLSLVAMPLPPESAERMILDDELGDPLCEGGDGLRWVEPESFGHDGAIGDIEPAVGEDRSLVVHDAVPCVRAHVAATQRMGSDQGMEGLPRNGRNHQRPPFRRAGQLFVSPIDRLDNLLRVCPRPLQIELVILQPQPAVRSVLAL